MRIALAAAFALSLTSDAYTQNPVPTSVWASKPTVTPAYRVGLVPWIKLADVKAKHAGQASWTEALFDDGRLMAHYIAAAPGTAQSARFHPDTREWFAVLEGEVRVEIEGQAPLVATRGSLVNIPRQTVYPKYTGGRFVRVDKSEMLVIYGYEKNMPPLDTTDKGHFHPESAEAWLVFTGKIRYAFEGQQPFIASEGDVVYVPSNTWHATRFIGDAASCRLSITEYVGNPLVLEPRPARARRASERERRYRCPPPFQLSRTIFQAPSSLSSVMTPVALA